MACCPPVVGVPTQVVVVVPLGINQAPEPVEPAVVLADDCVRVIQGRRRAGENIGIVPPKTDASGGVAFLRMAETDPGNIRRERAPEHMIPHAGLVENIHGPDFADMAGSMSMVQLRQPA